MNTACLCAAALLAMGCVHGSSQRSSELETSSRCKELQDSVASTVPRDSLPRVQRGWKFTPPTLPRNFNRGESTVLAFRVLPTGLVDLASLQISGTTDENYRQAAIRQLSKARYRAGLVSGCPVLSRVEYVTVSMQ